MNLIFFSLRRCKSLLRQGCWLDSNWSKTLNIICIYVTKRFFSTASIPFLQFSLGVFGLSICFSFFASFLCYEDAGCVCVCVSFYVYMCLYTLKRSYIFLLCFCLTTRSVRRRFVCVYLISHSFDTVLTLALCVLSSYLRWLPPADLLHLYWTTIVRTLSQYAHTLCCRMLFFVSLLLNHVSLLHVFV